MLKNYSKFYQPFNLVGEVGEFLGRGHYKRSKDESIKGYRNGYEPLRIKTGEGRIEAFMPQVRGTEDSFIELLDIRDSITIMKKN